MELLMMRREHVDGGERTSHRKRQGVVSTEVSTAHDLDDEGRAAWEAGGWAEDALVADLVPLGDQGRAEAPLEAVRLFWWQRTDPSGPSTVDAIYRFDGEVLVRLTFAQPIKGDPLAPPHRVSIAAEASVPTTRSVDRLGGSAAYGWVRSTLSSHVAEHIGAEWRLRPRRPGGSGHPEHFYAEWAARYVAMIEDTGADGALERLVERSQSTDASLTRSAIRRYLQEARKRALLTSAPPGHAGGELTAQGVRALMRVESPLLRSSWFETSRLDELDDPEEVRAYLRAIKERRKETRT